MQGCVCQLFTAIDHNNVHYYVNFSQIAKLIRIVQPTYTWRIIQCVHVHFVANINTIIIKIGH